MNAQPTHPFEAAPHRTLLVMALPVLLSMIAEPLTGLVDTAFVASLGAVALAALGVGTAALSSIFWIFNFLGIGGQTEVAQALGRNDTIRARQISGLTLALSGLFGVMLVGVGWLTAPVVTAALGASGPVQNAAISYFEVRLLGAPAVLATIAAFGLLRGLQDMRTPLWIALLVNGLNILLDGPLIFGAGPIPALGIAGAAWASIFSQWVGAAWAVGVVFWRLGLPKQLRAADAVRLLRAGGNLFVRTGLLTLFLLLTTRTATLIGPEGGAAHQAIRQVWVFTTLFLDAFAITGQSLIGYFVGGSQIAQARRVALYVCGWSVATGLALAALMVAGRPLVVAWLVPTGAVHLFGPAWLAAAITQPVNALAFATDGIHWGTGDFGFLRNAMLLATGCGASGILLIDPATPGALAWIWVVTGGWIVIRAIFGVIRVWPGVGQSPFRKKNAQPPAWLRA
ncbi:MAG: MATE family efflux transporter [Chloroflexi bacterium]|nr:MAG: MATE family efflux transporter [Chloroflexota bacterium]